MKQASGVTSCSIASLATACPRLPLEIVVVGIGSCRLFPGPLRR